MKKYHRGSLSPVLAVAALVAPLLTSGITLFAASAVLAAESLAPPPAPIVAGSAVPVVAHPAQQQLLQSTAPSLAASKKLVHDFWRNVIAAGDTTAIDDYLAADFIEHNPLLPTGRAAFRTHIEKSAQRRTVATDIADLVTLIAEGPYVALVLVSHYPEPDASGKTYTSTHFELFRIDKGRIAEHWDSALFRAGQQVPDLGSDKALPVVGVAGLAQHAQLTNDDPQLFANKRLAFDLWRQIPEGGHEELAALYLDPIYIQHNPNAATGRDGFIEYMARRPDSAIESWLETPLVAMIAEGDLVVQVLQTTRTQNGVTYQVPWFDMYRFANQRVIEHWDTASKGELPAAVPGGPLGL